MTNIGTASTSVLASLVSNQPRPEGERFALGPISLWASVPEGDRSLGIAVS